MLCCGLSICFFLIEIHAKIEFTTSLPNWYVSGMRRARGGCVYSKPVTHVYRRCGRSFSTLHYPFRFSDPCMSRLTSFNTTKPNKLSHPKLPQILTKSRPLEMTTLSRVPFLPHMAIPTSLVYSAPVCLEHAAFCHNWQSFLFFFFFWFSMGSETRHIRLDSRTETWPYAKRTTSMSIFPKV